MGKFFINVFIKNPIGFIVLGILITVFLGPINWRENEELFGFIGGPIIIAIGVIRIYMKKLDKESGPKLHMPLYSAIVKDLQQNGYEVQEYEHKNDRVRSSVYKNGNKIGELFIVAPPPDGSYTRFKEMLEKLEVEFQHDYFKKFGTSPETLPYYWPDKSLVGGYMHDPVKNYSEAGWMDIMANIVKGIEEHENKSVTQG